MCSSDLPQHHSLTPPPLVHRQEGGAAGARPLLPWFFPELRRSRRLPSSTNSPCCCFPLPSDPSTLLPMNTALTRTFFPSVPCTEASPGAHRSCAVDTDATGSPTPTNQPSPASPRPPPSFPEPPPSFCTIPASTRAP